MSPLKLSEIAARIDQHLKRFEASREINKSVRRNRVDTRPYHNACAYSIGRYVFVRYISHEGANSLSKDEALVYLAWLDAGGIGKHGQVWTSALLPNLKAIRLKMYMERRDDANYKRQQNI